MAKNREISDEVRLYFKENGLDVDEVFAELPLRTLTPEGQIDALDSKSTQTNILIFAFLLELRKQIKTTQECLAEMSKDVEKGFKELSEKTAGE